MTHDLVILAKSKKGDNGYCVAGLDLRSGEWIRLNMRGEYSIPQHLFCYESGEEINVLDAITIELTDYDTRFYHQPENHYCNIRSLKKITEDPRRAIKYRLEQDLKLHGSIFYDNNNRVDSAWLRSYQGYYYSLMIVEPRNVLFHRNSVGKLLVDFEYADKQYKNIRVTDGEFDSWIGDFAEYEVADAQYVFVASLGEDFQNPNSRRTENWKFIAAVIDAIKLKTGKAVEMSSLVPQNIEIIARQTPGIASFDNYEELKELFAEGLSTYNNTTYSLDNIDQARKDYATLKAIKKKLTDKKKEIEKAYTMPIQDVMWQLDSLIEMVKEPFSIIDRMLKTNAKAIKEMEIRQFAVEKSTVLGIYASSVINSPAFFNQRWLNASYKEKVWKSDILSIIEKAKNDISDILREANGNESIMLAYYFDKLSTDGLSEFVSTAIGHQKGTNDIPGTEADSIPETEGNIPNDVGSEIGIRTIEEIGEETKNNYAIIKITGKQEKIQEFLRDSYKYEVYWDLIESGEEATENVGVNHIEDNRQLMANEVPSSRNDNNSRSCYNCKLYRKEECAGLNGLCDDYEYAPTIPKEEVENWPTEMGPYVTGYGKRRR